MTAPQPVPSRPRAVALAVHAVSGTVRLLALADAAAARLDDERLRAVAALPRPRAPFDEP